MRERERERERERGEKEKEWQGRKRKNHKRKKIMEFYLVVLHSAERSEARQWIVARQVSCYNPLSCFNPVTFLFVFMFTNATSDFSSQTTCKRVSKSHP